MQTHYLEAIVAGILTAVIATATGVGDRRSETVATPITAPAPVSDTKALLERIRRDGADAR